MITYSTISFKVPQGYEQQITDLVMMKLEGILSTIILSPTEEKKQEFNQAMSEVCIQNKVEDNFIKKI
jgi:hypothetical protein